MSPIFSNHPEVVWNTAAQRIFSLLPSCKGVPFCALASKDLNCASYENFILKSNPEIITIRLESVMMVIDEELSTARGILRRDGLENIFILMSKSREQKFALCARYDSFANVPEKRWILMITEIPSPANWTGWGSYRSAGTRYIWSR